MDNKFSLKHFKLLPKKQQRAVYTIGFSLLGFALVVAVSCVLIFAKAKAPDSSSKSESSSVPSSAITEMKDPIANDKYGDTVLKKQDNKDANYLKETLFIGDSNTERLMEYGHISIDNYVGKTGLSITGAASEACVYFKNDDKAYAIPQAVAKMKPRRVVITLGTNDASDSVVTADFVKSYGNFVKAVTDAYPHAQVIINSIPPVTKNTTYKSISMDKINDLNEALADMALEKGYSFLNSSEALRDTSGYGKATYFTKEDGVHLVDGGARVLIDFVRTHPQTAEDKRPDTKNIPTRRAAPSAATSSTSSSSEAENKTITYSVQMDSKTAMGSLKNDSFDKKTTYTHTFKDETKKFSITAVAAEGYIFSKWSDGVKEATRSDAVPKDSAKITANFTKVVPFSLTLDKKDMSIEEGTEFTINATVTGEGIDVNKVVWKVDGTHVSTGKAFVGKYSPAKQTVYSIEASYPDKETKVTVKVTVTIKAPTPTPTPTPPPAVTTIVITGPSSGVVDDKPVFTAAVTNGNAADTEWFIGTSTTAFYKGASATVDANGEGKMIITAKNNGVTATKEFTVTSPTKSITISGAPQPKVGQSAGWTAVVTQGTTTLADTVTYTMTNDTTGGNVTLTAASGGVTCTFTEVGNYTLVASIASGESNTFKIEVTAA